MKKNVVFIGTRSWYQHIVPAVLSLLDHTEVDMVYLVIEDDEFPYDLPCNYTVINASGQEFFLPGSINYKNYFSYLCLLRVAFAKILPEDVEQVLSLDDDIIVVDDISPMWDVDLSGKWLAAVPETWKWGVDTECYYNCGVVMYNLKQMREDGIADQLIDYLNTVEVTFSDQVAINHFLATNPEKATKYPVRYNEFCNSGYTDNPAIVHYCGYMDWMTNNEMPRVGYLKMYQDKFRSSGMIEKREMIMAEKHNGCRYMIHACPKRMWYVEKFLLPSMLEQGIPENEILVWNDDHGWGNLKSFVESMRYVKQYFSPTGSIWHLQDDVVISDRFAEYTQEHGELAYGFCNAVFDPDNRDETGVVPINRCWHSFQCVCIPNKIAAEFYDWFDYLNTKTFRLMPWTKNGNNDDLIFRSFLHEERKGDTAVNVAPNLVDHIDYLLGGTTLHGRRPPRTAYHWDDIPTLRKLYKDLDKHFRVKPYKGKKYAVYSATRSYYSHLGISLRSLLKHNNMTKVFLMVEDDSLPFSLPKNCEIINISGQTLFSSEHLNDKHPRTYASALRVALSVLLPEYVDKVLSLDCDTIVCDDLTPLWSIDLDGKWIAGADSYELDYFPFGDRYYNGGVIMHNLAQQRKDNASEQMLLYLNDNKVDHLDETAINRYTVKQDLAVSFSTRYNECQNCGYTSDPAIVHYSGMAHWWEEGDFRSEYWNEYGEGGEVQ